MDRKILLEDRLFVYAFFLSLAFHGLLLSILPGFKLIEKIEFSEWLDVDLLVLPEFQTAVFPEAVSAESVESDAKTEHTGDSLVFPSPPLWLPERMNPIVSDAIPMRLTIPSDRLPDIAGMGFDTSTGMGIDLEPIDAAIQTLKPSGDSPPEIPWKPAQSTLSVDTDIENIDMQISGEVANRKVIFRPPVPRPVIPVSGVINLKFWVEPDGTIGKIVPITRTDPELERIAMEYIEKWRFETVSDNIGVQTGTIPIRIRLH